jgi:hypothetical protein
VAASVFYESGSELATLSNTFKVSGTPTDPTAVTLVVTSPTGTATTYNWPTPADLTHGSAGQFSKDVACSEDGEWQYVWTGTTAAADVEAGTRTVFQTDLGKLYATPQAVKNRLRITGTSDDYEVHAACFAASRYVEGVCERTFYRTASASARTFAPSGLYRMKLGPYNDLVSLTTLKTDSGGDGVFETTWTASDYQLYPLNPTAYPEPRPYTEIRAVGSQTFPWLTGFGRDDMVEATGVWGWPAVPRGVRTAATMVAEEIMKDAPFGLVSFGEFATRIRENPRIMKLLGPYVHPQVAIKVA